MTKIINFWGGPGLGKSTSAAELFSYMKRKGENVELVTEAIKDYVWEERTTIYTDQLYILAKQNRRIQRLVGKVEYVVTDSPVALSAIYCENYFETFIPFVMELWNSYDNINFLLSRDFEYQPLGRNETEEEAKAIDRRIKKFLIQNKMCYHHIVNAENRLEEIKEILWQEDSD